MYLVIFASLGSCSVDFWLSSVYFDNYSAVYGHFMSTLFYFSFFFISLWSSFTSFLIFHASLRFQICNIYIFYLFTFTFFLLPIKGNPETTPYNVQVHTAWMSRGSHSVAIRCIIIIKKN